MTRVRGKDGNVIQADFGGSGTVQTGIAAAADILYEDEHVTLVRVYVQLGGATYFDEMLIPHD